jgi:hypothetical protein
MAKVHIELTHSKWAMTPFTAEDHQVSILLLTSILISANDSNPIQFCQAITQSLQDKLLTVMNWGGSSRLDEPRMMSRFSLDESLCAARNWKISNTGYSMQHENTYTNDGS